MPEELPLDITVQEAHARLTSETPPLLLDVREDFERDLCQIDGHLAMPMQTVPEKLDVLPTGQPILVHCHHGGRSRRVTEFLRSKGYDQAQNVAGGIEAWSVEIDPSVPRY